MGPDLSLASEPAWQVRWLARVGRPRARLGVRPRDGPGCGFRWLVRVGRPRGSGARLGDLPPRDGDLRDGPGHGPPEPPPRTRSGTPWKNQTPDLPCLPVPRSQATDHLNSLREPGREPPGKIKLQTYLAHLFRGWLPLCNRARDPAPQCQPCLSGGSRPCLVARGELSWWARRQSKAFALSPTRLPGS